MKVRIISALLAFVMLIALLPVAASAMQIFVKLTVADGAGQTITLAVEPSDSVDSVKASIQNELGCAPNRQRLFFGNTLLGDGHTLEEFDIQGGSTLYLVVVPADCFTVTLLPGDGEGYPITYACPFSAYDDLPDHAGNLQFSKSSYAGMVNFNLNDSYCPPGFTAPEHYLFCGWKGRNDLRIIPRGNPNVAVTAKWTVDVFNVYGPVDGIPAANGGNIILGGVRWRVIGANDSRLLLLSSAVLSSQTTRDGSIERCGAVYSDFTDLEKAAVVTTTKGDGKYSTIETNTLGKPFQFLPAELSGAKLFLLSAVETEYYLPNREDRKTNNQWWLRSDSAINYDDDFPEGGFVDTNGSIALWVKASHNLYTRPAFQLDATKILLYSKAEGGKPEPGAGFAEFSAPAKDTDRKLTLLDPARQDFNAYADGSVCRGGRLTVQYSDAGFGEREYVSFMICETDGTPIYYASVKSVVNGVVTLEVPVDLAIGYYVLKVFSEQRNGDHETDYASGMKTFSIRVYEGVTASFHNYNGDLLGVDVVPTGGTPVYSGPTPTNPTGVSSPRIANYFTGWSPEIGPITERTSYIAQFRAEYLNFVTFDANGGEGTMPGDSYFACDRAYTLPECGFTPPEGKVFYRWIVTYANADGTMTEKFAAPGSRLTDLPSDLAVSPEWITLTLSVYPNGEAGTAEFDPATGTFTATANPGYTFDHWEYSNGDSGYVQPGTVWPTEAAYQPEQIEYTTYTAHFSRDRQRLNLIPVDETWGTVSSRGTPDTGRTITLTATPNEGYVFKRWDTYPGHVEIDAQNKFKMPAFDLTVSAVFVPENEPEFKTASLLLTGQIGVNFYADLSGLSEEERENVEVRFNVNGTVTADCFDETHTDPDGNGFYGFTCFVNSIEMADGITATLTYFGYELAELTYSVKDYVDYVLDNTGDFSDAAVALVSAIADYGHYAQLYFEPIREWTLGADHAAMPAVNEFDWLIIGDAESAVPDTLGSLNNYGTVLVGAGISLVLDTETAIRIYLTFEEGFDGDLELYKMVDNIQKPIGYTKLSDTRYMFEFSGIRADRLGDEIRVFVEGDSGHTLLAEIRLSPLTYAGAVLKSSDVTPTNCMIAALYRYYAAAKAYIQNPNG